MTKNTRLSVSASISIVLPESADAAEGDLLEGGVDSGSIAMKRLVPRNGEKLETTDAPGFTMWLEMTIEQT